MKRVSRPVLHVVDSLGLGGTQAILKDYFETRREDLNLHLLALRQVDQQVAIDHPNARIHSSPRRFSPAPLVTIRAIVRAKGIEVLHCHLFRSQVFGYLVKRLACPSVVLVFHEHGRAVGREGESRLEAFAFRFFIRVAAGSVDHFVCNSEHTRKSLLKIIPSAGERTSAVPNPIPVRPHASLPDRATLRHEAGVPEGAFAVGFASRLVASKGWRDFVDAMFLLADRMPVHFLLAGDGEDRGAVEAYVRQRNLGSRGQVLGQVDRMDRYYGALDCFVMPSHWESHGLGHLEAQAFGIPVAVSNVPGLRSTVHQNIDALLFPPGDPGAIADCVARIAGDATLRARLITAGRENAARFTMDGFVARLETIYAATGPASVQSPGKPG